MMRAHEFLLEYVNTKSAEFRAWFGASRVTSTEQPGGPPLVCYHGTDTRFDWFEPARSALGTHFTADFSVANQFARTSLDGDRISPHVIPVYLRIENPIRIKDFGEWDAFAVIDYLANRGFGRAGQAILSPSEADHLRKIVNDGYYSDFEHLVPILKKKGFDGFVYDNEGEGGGDSWTIFDPSQARSVFDFNERQPHNTFGAPMNEASTVRGDFEDELKAIAAFADSIGVEFEAEASHGDLALLDIARNGGSPGAGSQVMQKLVDFCDRHGLEMTLDCKQGIPRLREYYESFGFEMEQDAMDEMDDPDFQGPWLMYRMPRHINEGEVVDLGKHKMNKAMTAYADTIRDIYRGEKDFFSQGKFMPFAQAYIESGYKPDYHPTIYLCVEIKPYRSPELSGFVQDLRAKRFEVRSTKYHKDFPKEQRTGPYCTKVISFDELREIWRNREHSPYGAYQPSRSGFRTSHQDNYDERGVGFHISVLGYDPRRADKYGNAVREEDHIIDNDADFQEVSNMFAAINRSRIKVAEDASPARYAQPVLFHGTDFISLVGIVQSNQFGEERPNTVSMTCFTRSKAVAVHFAQRRSNNFFEAWEVTPEMTDEDVEFLKENYPLALAEYEATHGHGHGCVIVVNRQRLAHNHKIVARDESQGGHVHSVRSPDYRDHLKRQYGDDYWKHVEAQYGYESEESVLRTVKDARRYIDGIFFRQPREWTEMKEAVRKLFGSQYDAALAFIDSKVVSYF